MAVHQKRAGKVVVVPPPRRRVAPAKCNSSCKNRAGNLEGDVLLNFSWQDVGPRSAGPLSV